jgi:hypothetical protein
MSKASAPRLIGGQPTSSFGAVKRLLAAGEPTPYREQLALAMPSTSAVYASE